MSAITTARNLFFLFIESYLNKGQKYEQKLKVRRIPTHFCLSLQTKGKVINNQSSMKKRYTFSTGETIEADLDDLRRLLAENKGYLEN